MVSRSNSQGVGKDTSDSSNYLQFLHDPYRIIIILRTLRLHARLSKGLKAVSYQLSKNGDVSYEWCSAVVGGALGAVHGATAMSPLVFRPRVDSL